MSNNCTITYSDSDFITLENFSQLVNKSQSTIIKRYKEIPLIVLENGYYKVLKGTRYPAKKNFKADDYSEKKYEILKAIFKFKYIDETYVGLYPNDFELILYELIQSGYIQYNNGVNTFGANAYNITDKGTACVKKGKRKATVEIMEMAQNISKVAGTFVGSVISEIYNP